MVSNNTYRKYLRQNSGQRLYKNTKKTPLWIDRRTERHARLIAILFFLGIVLSYSIGIRTLATWNTISRLFFAFAVVTSFIPGKFFPLLYRIRKEMKILFTIFGLSPVLTGLVLLINFSFVHDVRTESYKINRVTHYSNDYLFKIELENNEMQKFTQLRTFSSDDYRFYPDSAHYRVGKGCFYFNVVRNAYLTP